MMVVSHSCARVSRLAFLHMKFNQNRYDVAHSLHLLFGQFFFFFSAFDVLILLTFYIGSFSKWLFLAFKLLPQLKCDRTVFNVVDTFRRNFVTAHNSGNSVAFLFWNDPELYLFHCFCVKSSKSSKIKTNFIDFHFQFSLSFKRYKL